MPAHADRPLIIVMCLTQVTGMLGFSSFAALLPTFMADWNLTESAAGWLNGCMFAGYMGAVPLLMALTDRLDARAVFLLGSLVSALSLLLFGIAADGFWSALALRLLAGVGMAGSYMPGLRVLTDRLDATEQSRAVAFYTATYGIGTALSFYLAGELTAWLGWRMAFALIALGPLSAMLLVALFTRPRRVDAATAPPLRQVLDFRSVFRNRRAVAYIFAYTLHTGELMAMLSWLVAYLTFATVLSGEAVAPGTITIIGSAVALVALPASILGNEGALRFGRRRFISLVMITCGLFACVVGFAAGLPFPMLAALCLVYGALIATDSASLTAGTVAAAEPGRQGATIAMHSFIGFGGGFVAPLLFGAVLQAAGGRLEASAWGYAFAAIGLSTLLGPLVLARWAPDAVRTAVR